MSRLRFLARRFTVRAVQEFFPQMLGLGGGARLRRGLDSRRVARGLGRRVAPSLLFLGILVAIFAFAPSAHAYSWMLRHGYTACGTCHADPSGGELLTAYGRASADLLLTMQYGEPKTDPGEPGLFWGVLPLPENLLVSGSYRTLSILQPGLGAGTAAAYRFIPAMQADAYAQVRFGDVFFGGSLGVGYAREGSLLGRGAQLTTNEEGYNLLSRTHYVGFALNDQYTLRAGRLNLPFGIRTPEHTLWARQATRTDRESQQQHGVALAYVAPKLRAELMAIAGNYQLGGDDYRERGYSFFLEALADPRFATGISSKVTYSSIDRITYEADSLRQAHGLFARYAPFTPLVFLLEVDTLFRTNADAGYTGFLQADYEPIQGLHFILTGEFLDEGLPIDARVLEATPGLGNPRLGGWFSVDYFFFRQLEMRVDAIARQNEPLTLLAQLHLFL